MVTTPTEFKYSMMSSNSSFSTCWQSSGGIFDFGVLKDNFSKISVVGNGISSKEKAFSSFCGIKKQILQ